MHAPQGLGAVFVLAVALLGRPRQEATAPVPHEAWSSPPATVAGAALPLRALPLRLSGGLHARTLNHGTCVGGRVSRGRGQEIKLKITTKQKHKENCYKMT